MSIRSLFMLCSAAILVGLVGCAPQTTDEVGSIDVVVPDLDSNVTPDVTTDQGVLNDNGNDDDLNVVVEKDVE